jgi:hypothetical protein
MNRVAGGLPGPGPFALFSTLNQLLNWGRVRGQKTHVYEQVGSPFKESANVQMFSCVQMNTFSTGSDNTDRQNGQADKPFGLPDGCGQQLLGAGR